MIDWLNTIDWTTFDWITPAIHLYAAVLLVLLLFVYIYHSFKLRDLGARVGTIVAQIEGRNEARPVHIRGLSATIIQLAETIDRRTDLDVSPVLEYVRRQEASGRGGISVTLVNVTETMIELLPILGILGTVYAISGVGNEQFKSAELMGLFGIAIRTTLFALLYLVIFRLIYSAFVAGKLAALDENRRHFDHLLGALERRTQSLDYGVQLAGDPWSPRQ